MAAVATAAGFMATEVAPRFLWRLTRANVAAERSSSRAEDVEDSIFAFEKDNLFRKNPEVPASV